MILDTPWMPAIIPGTTATAASTGEAAAGTDAVKYVTPAGLAAAVPGLAASVVNPRAPAQALVFDGTATALQTLPTELGATDKTLAFRYQVRTAGGFIQHISVAGIVPTARQLSLLQVGTTRVFRVELVGATTADIRQANTTLAAGADGEWVSVAVVFSSGVLTIYINGVAFAYTESTAGTPPAWSETVGGTFVRIGGVSTSIITGGLGPIYPFNRALSAAEVLALYQTGAPAAADYNSASNTTINTSSAVDGVAGGNTFAATAGGSFSGASATGFSAVSGGGAYAAASFQPNFSVQPGQIIRVTYTATVNSGTVLASIMNSGVSSISAAHTVTTGTRTVELIATAASATARIIFGSSGAAACNFVVSAVAIVRCGLLAAPDAAQPGAGLQWLDASGNRAHLTLPTSGVRWSLPNVSGQVVVEATVTHTAGTNVQLGGGSLIDTSRQWRIVSISANSTAISTITLGNVSAGAQHVASVALAVGNNACAIVSGAGNFLSTANLWSNSSAIATIRYTLTLAPA